MPKKYFATCLVAQPKSVGNGEDEVGMQSCSLWIS